MGRNKLKVRQRVFLSTRMKIIAGTFVSVGTIISLIIYFNFFKIKESNAFSSGDYRTVASGNWDDTSLWETFDGESWSPAMKPPGDGVNQIIVTNNQAMTITEEIPLNNLIIDFGSTVTIESNTVTFSKFNNAGGLTCKGTLELGTSILEGNGDFILAQGAKLKIGSDAGIDKKNQSGNIQMTGKREFHTNATYIYNGTVSQHTGNGLPGELRTLIVDNESGLILDQNLQVTDTLNLANGVINTGNNSLTLGTSAFNICKVITGSGRFQGKIKLWFGSLNFKNIDFNCSEGDDVYTIHFSQAQTGIQKGMIELVYRAGLPDDAHKSPFEARQVVVAITQNGHYAAMLSNGAEEAWLQLEAVSQHTTNNSEISWNIYRKSDLEIEMRNKGGNTLHKPKAISNILYGPVPFNKFLVIRFYCDTRLVTSIQVMNAKSQIVYTEKIEAEQGYNQVKIPVEKNYISGDYMVQISNPSEIHTFKVACFIKQETVEGS